MISKKNGIGVLGGSFDPIHLGHTQSAEAVAKELNLEQVLLIPAYISPLKTSPGLTPHATAQQRTKMVELACLHNSLFTCDTREVKREGHSYTVDTLKELKRLSPDKPIYFIIGMDSLLTFTKWHHYADILTLCHLVVNTRPNYLMSQLNNETKALLDTHITTDKNQLLHYDAGKIYFAQPCLYDISSTNIRHCIAQNKEGKKQLLPEISDFIHKNKLYR